MPLKLLQRIPPPSNLSHPCSALHAAACLLVLQAPNGRNIIYASTTRRFSARDRTIRSRRFSHRPSSESTPPRIRANQPCCLDFHNPSLFAYKPVEVLPQCSNIRSRCILGWSDFGQHGKLGGLPPAVHVRPDGRRLLQPRVQQPDLVPRCAAIFFLFANPFCATCFSVRRFAVWLFMLVCLGSLQLCILFCRYLIKATVTDFQPKLFVSLLNANAEKRKN